MKKNNFENILINKQKNFYFKKFISKKNIDFAFYSTTIFLVPLIISYQLITGSFVNAILVKSALTQSTKKIALISILPSTAALTGGILFGNFSNTLIYLLPFIWVSNFIFSVGIKKFFVEKKVNYFISGTVFSLVKAIILFSSVFVLVNHSLIPESFLTPFGVLQLVTAMVGVISIGLLSMKI